jgi:hypothetical protein
MLRFYTSSPVEAFARVKSYSCAKAGRTHQA